jgi:PII-like signaling protein
MQGADSVLVPGPAKKIIIHVNDDTSSRHDFLYKEILAMLLERGVAGATLLYPQGGFGAHHLMHMQGSMQMQGSGIDAGRHLPVRIEFIETAENVEALLPALYELITDGLIESQDTTILKAAFREQPGASGGSDREPMLAEEI